MCIRSTGGGHLTCQVPRAHRTDLLRPQSPLEHDEAGAPETEDEHDLSKFRVMFANFAISY